MTYDCHARPTPALTLTVDIDRAARRMAPSTPQHVLRHKGRKSRHCRRMHDARLLQRRTVSCGSACVYAGLCSRRHRSGIRLQSRTAIFRWNM